MEEIDIIELLKRVKEGKAPKRIKVNQYEYTHNNSNYISSVYVREQEIPDGFRRIGWFDDYEITFGTKIKILDKPIIEELHKKYDVCNPKELKECVEDLGSKINEIIKYINKEEK